jgi:hypothetical protein
LIFIKGLKVGGTTVAIALDHIARRFHIPLHAVAEGTNQQFVIKEPPVCVPGASLYFHHGYKHDWMEEWCVFCFCFCLENFNRVSVVVKKICINILYETVPYRSYVNAEPGISLNLTVVYP